MTGRLIKKYEDAILKKLTAKKVYCGISGMLSLGIY
jgi:hypothetical protein